MQAQPDRAHLAYAYLRAGLSIIPCERGLKTPSHVLPGQHWKPYQERQPTEAELDAWLAFDPECNWGLVCGQGLICADADDRPLAQWLLEHPTHPALHGAAVQRSGSGKAHLMFRTSDEDRTTVWDVSPGRRAGEVKGRGSYVLVPPSKLDGAGSYDKVYGSLNALPTLPDVPAYLQGVVAAYLAEHPTQPAAEFHDYSSRRVLSLDDDQRDAVVSRIKALGLKTKITDTLFKPGFQDPGTRHWPPTHTHSEIDCAVVCELVRKGLDFGGVREVYAATLVGDARYRGSVGSTGDGYLQRTFDDARRRVEAAAQQARAARGDNFVVLDATRTRSDTEAYYHLSLEIAENPPRRGAIDLGHKELLNAQAWTEVCAGTLDFVPTFLRAHKGNDFKLLAAAVMGMCSDTTRLPEGAGRASYLCAVARQVIRSRLFVARPALPQAPEDTGSLGWQFNGKYYLRLVELYRGVKAQEQSAKPMEVYSLIDKLGRHDTQFLRWPGGAVEQFIVLDLVLPGSGPTPVS